MPIHAQGGTDSLLLAPDRAAATATRAATLDTRGASYTSIRVCLSSAVNTNATSVVFTLQHDDTTVVTNFSTLTATNSVTITQAGQITYHVDNRGKQRFFRLLSTPATTTNDLVTVGAITSLTRQGEWPSSAAEMSATAAIIVV